MSKPNPIVIFIFMIILLGLKSDLERVDQNFSNWRCLIDFEPVYFSNGNFIDLLNKTDNSKLVFCIDGIDKILNLKRNCYNEGDFPECYATRETEIIGVTGVSTNLTVHVFEIQNNHLVINKYYSGHYNSNFIMVYKRLSNPKYLYFMQLEDYFSNNTIEDSLLLEEQYWNNFDFNSYVNQNIITTTFLDGYEVSINYH